MSSFASKYVQNGSTYAAHVNALENSILKALSQNVLSEYQNSIYVTETGHEAKTACKCVTNEAIFVRN